MGLDSGPMTTIAKYARMTTEASQRAPLDQGNLCGSACESSTGISPVVIVEGSADVDARLFDLRRLGEPGFLFFRFDIRHSTFDVR